MTTVGTRMCNLCHRLTSAEVCDHTSGVRIYYGACLRCGASLLQGDGPCSCLARDLGRDQPPGDAAAAKARADAVPRVTRSKP